MKPCCPLKRHEYTWGYYISVKPSPRSRKRVMVLVQGCSACPKVKETR